MIDWALLLMGTISLTVIQFLGIWAWLITDKFHREKAFRLRVRSGRARDAVPAMIDAPRRTGRRTIL